MFKAVRAATAAAGLLLGEAAPPPHTSAVRASTPPIAAVVVDQMRLAADYFIATESAQVRDDCGWEQAAFLQGIMALHGITSDQKYKDFALTWAARNKFEMCAFPGTLLKPDAANWESCGQTYAELYFLDSLNYTYIANTVDVLSVQVNRSQIDDWWWVDAFFMAMGTFSRIGACPRHL